jgi:hypothetical protein
MRISTSGYASRRQDGTVGGRDDNGGATKEDQKDPTANKSSGRATVDDERGKGKGCRKMSGENDAHSLVVAQGRMSKGSSHDKSEQMSPLAFCAVFGMKGATTRLLLLRGVESLPGWNRT